jgi:hypothetical protein
MVVVALLASLALGLFVAGRAAAATLTQVRTQLSAWHLQPAPLFPSQLPASYRGANVSLDRFAGVDFDIEFGKPANGCQRVNATDLCMELRRADAATLTSMLHDPDNCSVPRQVQVGARRVWFLCEGRDAGGWVLAWHEQGRTYWAWEWTADSTTALPTLSALVQSLQGVTAASGCPAYGVVDSRGSGEPEGKLSPPAAAVLTAVRRHHPGVRIAGFWNPYPADGLTDDPREWLNALGAGLHAGPLGAYHGSVVDGEQYLRDFIPRELRTCSAIKLILVGYSQGAQVTGDVFQRHLTTAQKRSISGVLLFGDPYFNSSDRQADQGDFDHHRSGALGNRRTFGGDPRVRSFCHQRDPVCQATWHRIPEPQLFLRWGFKQHENYPSDAAQAAAGL